jgi:GNAT superfamily N-acetyltransferase
MMRCCAPSRAGASTAHPCELRSASISPIVERFDRSRHDVLGFACGNPTLDHYIQQTVIRDEDDHTAAAYVLVSPAQPGTSRRVIGYYTLSSFALSKGQTRRRDRDKYLGAYEPVPAALIGRLALDAEFQGRGLGSVLLSAALGRVLIIREALGIAVAVVHAIDEAAAAFYEHQNFTRFRSEPNHLYYPLATFVAGIGEAAPR